jgi:hypothetical protein
MEMMARSKSRRDKTRKDEKQAPPQQATPLQNQQPIPETSQSVAPNGNQPAPQEATSNQPPQAQDQPKSTGSKFWDRAQKKMEEPETKARIDKFIAFMDKKNSGNWNELSPEAKRRMAYTMKILTKSSEAEAKEFDALPWYEKYLGIGNPHSPFKVVDDQVKGILDTAKDFLDSPDWNGTPEEFGKVKTGTPEQESYLKSLYDTEGGKNDPLYQAGYQGIQSILNNDPESIKAFEAPYLENFEQNIVPGLLEKYGGMGTGRGSTGSGLQNSLAQAGRGLQKDLAASREALKETARGQAGRYSNIPTENRLTGLGWSPYETYHKEAQPGMKDYLAKTGIDLAGKAIGAYAGV